MTLVSRIALGAAIALGGGAPAAIAQVLPAGVTLADEEREALLAAQTALNARDYATAATAIATAKSQARSGYARYLASSWELRLGMETRNNAVQASAIDAMIESGVAPAASMEELYKNRGALALASGNLDRAEGAFTRWSEVAPNNPAALVALAEVKDDRRKINEAVALIDRAIDMRKAAGQTVPESWYRRGLKHAFDAKLAAPSLKLARGLVADYPSRENWRDAILIYRDVAQPDPQARLDLLRLKRATKALGGERDYMDMAEALATDKLPAEIKAVLDEGVAAKMIDPKKASFKELIASSGKEAASDRKALAALEKKAGAAADGTAAVQAADNHYAFGEYAKAAELYRLALQKGAVDPALVNTRLGMALALAGRKAEAETALRAVTGPRANLASYWLVWLAQSGRPA